MRYEEMEHRFLCGNFSGDVFCMGFLDKGNRTGFKDFCLFHWNNPGQCVSLTCLPEFPQTILWMGNKQLLKEWKLRHRQLHGCHQKKIDPLQLRSWKKGEGFNLQESRHDLYSCKWTTTQITLNVTTEIKLLDESAWTYTWSLISEWRYILSRLI